MTAASKSIYYFGFYLLITGVTLVVSPNTLLSLFQIPETTEIWIRVLGAVVFGLGLYYVFMASVHNVLFLVLTMYVRVFILISFIIFAIIDWAPLQLILFGLIDAGGAVWTYIALKKG